MKSVTWLQRFVRQTAGNFAVIAAIAAPAMIGMAGLATDYVTIFKHQKELQEASDGAALASVRELMLAGTKDAYIQEVASAFVSANLEGISPGENVGVEATVDREANEVRVRIAYTWTPMFAHFFDTGATRSSLNRLRN